MYFNKLMTRCSPCLSILLVAIVSASCSYGIYHKVQDGDTIYAIGRTYGVKPAKIISENRMSEPETLHVGQMVFIPGASSAKRIDRPTMPASKSTGVRRKKTTQKSKKTKSPSRSSMPSNAPKFKWPTKGEVTSGYGKLKDRTHDGIDIGAPRGTSIIAAADGTVIYAGNGLSGYGNLLIVKHDGGYSTIYAHNDENLVRRGSFVAKGEQIATVGSTGRSSGPHLHFEIRKGKKAINPLQYLP